jgi:hypothetical protein
MCRAGGITGKLTLFSGGRFTGKYGILFSTQKHSQELLARKEALVAGTIEINPSENSNWRKHKNACPFYRERWFPGNDVMAGEPMYQVFCMKGTPPVTLEDQERCLHSKTCCWRLAAHDAQTKKKTESRKTSSEEAAASAR